jgi:hypothetical protein
VATAESAPEALELADAAAKKLVVRTARNARMTGDVRVLVPVLGVALVAAAAAIVLFAVHGGVRPHLLRDTLRRHGNVVRVAYAFNEPVRALLLVDGRPATTESALRTSGALLWHRRAAGSHRIEIEGIDRSGHRAVVRL